jgi:uncharacterized membrane protein YdjX (TVP38/TMEM64 family)
LVFGPWLTFIISLLAISIGSLLNFYIGRRFGKHIIIWIIGKDDAIKWGKKLSTGKYVFFLMMLFPIFPDDILCLVVGATTSISYKFFIITNLITRPISLASTCFLGSGQLIPFSGWGIPIWILIFILGAFISIITLLLFIEDNKYLLIEEKMKL